MPGNVTMVKGYRTEYNTTWSFWADENNIQQYQPSPSIPLS
jgi:hypothetical protein